MFSRTFIYALGMTVQLFYPTLICSVILGAALIIGLKILLVNTFGLDRLDWFYIPVGMLVLWLVGQVAVFGPARKAANIPPALATRTV
jgi:putative ABC transport system permease protein